MNDVDALLQGIMEHPADDVRRLVIADWYEENGQPDRAAFIRAQIDLVNRVVVGADYAQQWEHVADGLLNAAGQPHDPIPSNVHTVYWRGFIDGLCLPAPQLIRQPASTWERLPIRHLWLGRSTMNAARAERGDWRQLVGLLSRHPLLRRLESLRFAPLSRRLQDWEADAIAAFLVACPVLPNLHELSIRAIGWNGQYLRRVLESGKFPNLERIRTLNGDDLSLQLLRESGIAWRGIGIHWFGGTASAFQTWLQTMNFSELDTLELTTCERQDSRWQGNPQWQNDRWEWAAFPKLRSLTLHGEWFPVNEPFQSWLDRSPIQQLQHLSLEHNALTPPQAHALLHDSPVEKLESLSFRQWHHQGAHETAEVVVSSRALKGLRHGSFDCGIPEFWEALARHPHSAVRQVVHLHFPDHDPARGLVHALREGADLPNLTILELPHRNRDSFPDLDEQTIERMTNLNLYPRLRLISLDGEDWLRFHEGYWQPIPQTIVPMPW